MPGWKTWRGAMGFARTRFTGMEVNEAKRLRDLEQENARLKRLLAEAELDKAALKELVEGNW